MKSNEKYNMLRNNIYSLKQKLQLFCRETNLHDKCSEKLWTHGLEKMDNKTIQKLRDLYLKVIISKS